MSADPHPTTNIESARKLLSRLPPKQATSALLEQASFSSPHGHVSPTNPFKTQQQTAQTIRWQKLLKAQRAGTMPDVTGVTPHTPPQQQPGHGSRHQAFTPKSHPATSGRRAGPGGDSALQILKGCKPISKVCNTKLAKNVLFVISFSFSSNLSPPSQQPLLLHCLGYLAVLIKIICHQFFPM